eukprot:1160247-Pelagomonas_calceolata.AAC.21
MRYEERAQEQLLRNKLSFCKEMTLKIATEGVVAAVAVAAAAVGEGQMRPWCPWPGCPTWSLCVLAHPPAQQFHEHVNIRNRNQH